MIELKNTWNRSIKSAKRDRLERQKILRKLTVLDENYPLLHDCIRFRRPIYTDIKKTYMLSVLLVLFSSHYFVLVPLAIIIKDLVKVYYASEKYHEKIKLCFYNLTQKSKLSFFSADISEEGLITHSVAISSDKQTLFVNEKPIDLTSIDCMYLIEYGEIIKKSGAQIDPPKGRPYIYYDCSRYISLVLKDNSSIEICNVGRDANMRKIYNKIERQLKGAEIPHDIDRKDLIVFYSRGGTEFHIRNNA
ncbi:hypothetical protein [Vibrio sp. PNB22_4_1]|uniref:hypothetical protein n=1 Tax=unclassified Vibrio TaxID=2614977 RepID=UPI00406AA923